MTEILARPSASDTARRENKNDNDLASATGKPGTPGEPGTPGKPELARSLGLVGAVLLTLSCLTPASSLFVIVPGLFATQGTGTALTLAIAGVLCVGVAFCYSELGTLIPSAGGEYAMVGSLLGRLSGWLTFFLAGVAAFIIPPIIAIGTGEYLHAASRPFRSAVPAPAPSSWPPRPSWASSTCAPTPGSPVSSWCWK